MKKNILLLFTIIITVSTSATDAHAIGQWVHCDLAKAFFQLSAVIAHGIDTNYNRNLSGSRGFLGFFDFLGYFGLFGKPMRKQLNGLGVNG